MEGAGLRGGWVREEGVLGRKVGWLGGWVFRGGDWKVWR